MENRILFVDAKSKMTIELDTIVRDWHMLLQTADNGIKNKNENFYDKTLFVTNCQKWQNTFPSKGCNYAMAIRESR